MRLLALLLGMLASAQTQAAPFALNQSTCSIAAENVVALKIGNEQLDSKIRVELVMMGESAPLPTLKITFLTHEPTKATFEWPSIVHSKKNVKLFRSEIFDRVIQQQGKHFTMKRVSRAGEKAVFQTDVLSMNAIQNMIALFLSQNDFTIHAFADEGDDWTGTFSLAMSDSSFRQMAAKCFATQSEKYLTATGERADLKISGIKDKNALAAMPYYWSEGYGLTPYTELETLVPSDLKNQPVFAESDSDDDKYKKLSEWIHTLVRKQTTMAELTTNGNDPAFIAVNTELTGYYKKLDATYSRFVVLTGDNSTSDGLISQKIKEQEALQVALTEIETKIASAQQTLDPLLADQSLTANQLAPFMDHLTNIENLKASHSARIQEIASLQTHLQDLLTRHQSTLAASVPPAAAEGPWSVEEIEKQDKEAAIKLQKAQALVVLQQQVQTIVGDLQGLLDKANAQQTASMAYLQAVAEQRSLKAEMTKEETWLYQSQNVPKFTVAAKEFFDALNTTVESNVARELEKSKAGQPSTVRDYKWEFDFHSNAYNHIEAEFLKIVATSKSQGSLISSILCPPSVLKDEKNRKQPCLTVDDVLDEKIVENFLSTLPPKDVDDLLGTVPRPWNQESSKTQLLIGKYESELANPTANLQELVDTWGALRQVIWRWVTLQKKAKALDVCDDREAAAALFASGNYTPEYYNKVIECERVEVLKHKARKKELLDALATSKASIDQAQSAFDSADVAYDTASQEFINGAMAKLKDVPALSDQTQIFSTCLLPLEKPEDCATAIGDITSGKLAHQAQNEYTALVQALVSHIHSRMTLMGQENTTAVSEVARLEKERVDYITANNVTPLLEKRDALKLQIESSQTELAALKTTQQQKNSALSTARNDEGTFKTEAQALIAELTATTDKIKSTLPTLMPFCARILPYTHRLQQIDAALYVQMKFPTPNRPTKYSSCQIPNLENYIPAPKAIEQLGVSRGQL